MDAPFSVNGVDLPAGRYQVNLSGGDVFHLRAADGRGVMFLTTRTGSPLADFAPRVVLRETNGKLELTEIWFGDRALGYCVAGRK
jgi:hypothetical protein